MNGVKYLIKMVQGQDSIMQCLSRTNRMKTLNDLNFVYADSSTKRVKVFKARS